MLKFKLFNKRGLSLMEIIIYIVILAAFLGLMIFISARLGDSGGGMIKYIRDFFKFGR